MIQLILKFKFRLNSSNPQQITIIYSHQYLKCLIKKGKTLNFKHDTQYLLFLNASIFRQKLIQPTVLDHV